MIGPEAVSTELRYYVDTVDDTAAADRSRSMVVIDNHLGCEVMSAEGIVRELQKELERAETVRLKLRELSCSRNELDDAYQQLLSREHEIEATLRYHHQSQADRERLLSDSREDVRALETELAELAACISQAERKMAGEAQAQHVATYRDAQDYLGYAAQHDGRLPSDVTAITVQGLYDAYAVTEKRHNELVYTTIPGLERAIAEQAVLARHTYDEGIAYVARERLRLSEWATYISELIAATAAEMAPLTAQLSKHNADDTGEKL